ncbi:MAG: hypothetical protein IJT59_01415, partial [Desulfovibrionaceae bacterium]|nr:hypothetical protein [Desulfovibrionaceae bacterium]
MPLNLNGYTNQFNNFVNFANHEIKDGSGKKAIAFISGTNALSGHKITANDNDSVGARLRSQDFKDANNAVRTIFKKTIAEMFGGENNIPKKVLDAMKLDDYGKGKPLTARRILAVKKAIDQDGSVKLSAFKYSDTRAVALQKGWNEAELPKLARATHFLCSATGVDEFEALEQLSKPGTPANRLMNYGGRFTESAENFANGLRLMDSFADWFKNLCSTMQPVFSQKAQDRDYTPANTFTKLNIDPNIAKESYLKGLEKFAFEELSVNPKANLSERNMEALFGFQNNKAMNFFGRGFGGSFYSTLSNVPKEKRAIIYTAINSFTLSAKNAQEAHDKNIGGGSLTWIRRDNIPTVIAKMLNNFDKVEGMYNKGNLTPKNLINAIFPEIPEKGDYNYETINNYLDNIAIELSLDKSEGGKYTDVSSAVPLAMENSGCSFEETVQALRDGQALPIPKYLSTGTIPLEEMDGTVTGGRKLIENDLDRPDFCYRFKNDLNKPLLNPKIGGFGFNFPGSEKFYTNGTQEGRANIKLVGDKVVEMCGSVHVKQANSVLMMLSQSGLSNLRSGLSQVNSTSNEHAPVDYTLTKNEQTGDITIKYSSPEDLPFNFKWTSTIDINGNITSTPLTIEKKKLDPQIVSTTLDNALTRMNNSLPEDKKINFNESMKARASDLIGELGLAYKLEGKKLDLFANFVVHLKLTTKSAVEEYKLATDMAKNISHWTEFEVGQGEEIGVGTVEKTIANHFNELVDDAIEDADE